MDEELLAFAYSKEQEQEHEQTMDYSQCFNCGGSDFIEIDYERICEECQAIDPRYAVFCKLRISRVIHVIKDRTIPVWTTLKRAFSDIKVEVYNAG